MACKLTIVATGRNDSYMGNFKYRLASSVNMVARQAARLGRLEDVEYLVTDWGSEVPLAEVLPLTGEAARICRFAFVPPEVARARRADDYFPSCAANTSIRRARGEFCLLFDADSLMPFTSMRNLLDLVDGRLPLPYDPRRPFYFFPRHHVPWEVVQREPDVEGWERYLALNAGSLPADPTFPGLGGSGAGQMMERSGWHELGGYNEQMVGQGWIDCEFTMRATQTRPLVDLASLGIALYHMEHWPRNRRRRWVNRVENELLVSPSLKVNDENWGVGDRDVRLLEPRQVLPAPGAPSPLPQASEILQALPRPQTRACVAGVLRRWALPAREWEVLAPLVGFALTRFPRSMVELGSLGHLGAVSVANAAPGIELYLAETFRRAGPLSTPGHLAAALREAGHRGFARYMTAPPEASLSRLKESWVGTPEVDLACLWEEALEGHGPALAGEAAGMLAEGGMLALAARSPEALERMLASVEGVRPGLACFAGASGCTAVLLRAAGPGVPGRLPDPGPSPHPAPAATVRRLVHLGRRVFQEPAMARRILGALATRVLRRSPEEPAGPGARA